MQALQLPWRWMRGVMVALSVFGGKSIVHMQGDFSKPSIPFGLGVVAFCVFGMCFVWLLRKINPRSDASWERPSWSANPFAMQRPLEMFHFGAWCVLASALGAFALGMFGSPRNWAWELPFCAGVGTLLGVYLVAVINRPGANT